MHICQRLKNIKELKQKKNKKIEQICPIIYISQSSFRIIFYIKSFLSWLFCDTNEKNEKILDFCDIFIVCQINTHIQRPTEKCYKEKV